MDVKPMPFLLKIGITTNPTALLKAYVQLPLLPPMLTLLTETADYFCLFAKICFADF